jgi:outer membrane protein OmpA-like peptidoglycan-associated protein
MDITDTPAVASLIRQSAEKNTAYATADFTLTQCEKLSEQRAQNVRRACVEYAKSKNFDLDESQIGAVGVGCLEPVIPTPRSKDDQLKNCRVEFRLVKIQVEAVTEFDF